MVNNNNFKKATVATTFSNKFEKSLWVDHVRPWNKFSVLEIKCSSWKVMFISRGRVKMFLFTVIAMLRRPFS